MSRRRRHRLTKPIIPGLRWLLLTVLLLSLTFGIYGALSYWSRFDRITSTPKPAP
jgi:hypothetical protein